MPILKKAPRRRIGHHLPYYFGNSLRGLVKTHQEGIQWHDFDHVLTEDGVWRISHGHPEEVFFKNQPPFSYTRQEMDRMRHETYRPGKPLVLYRDAAHLGINVEIEPKGKDPRYKDVKFWRKAAANARRAWGDQWQKHTYVKVLNNNGTEFAIKVITAASEAGFTAGPTRDWNLP